MCIRDRAEAARQRTFLKAGGVVARETRRWDDARGESVLLRGKESAEDYRFFPEPDLPDVRLEQHWIDSLKATVPELPAARQGRYQAMGFPPEKAAAGTGAPRLRSAAPSVRKNGSSASFGFKPAICSRAETMAFTRGAKSSGEAASPRPMRGIWPASMLSLIHI